MTEPVQITIDGRPVATTHSATVLDAAVEAGLDIPCLCAHARLPCRGACRVCLVEVDGQARPVPACTTRVRDGMCVLTKSEAATRARRLVLELLLSDHPADCTTCAGQGKCELAELVRATGIRRPTLDRLPSRRGTDDSSPVIRRDMDKCILCGRCVAMCNDVDGHNALAMAGEGVDASVAPQPGPGLADSRCTACGDCLQVCPTAALVDRFAESEPAQGQLTCTATVCPFCGVGCRVILHTRGQRVVSVAGDWDGPANMGSLCVRGRLGCTFVHSPDRLRLPMVRRQGRLVETTWEDALDCAAAGLNAAKAKGAAAVVCGGTCTNEESYLLGKFARTALGLAGCDTGADYVQAAAGLGLAGPAECEEADVLLAVAGHVEATAPVVANAVKRAAARGATLILAQPLPDALTECAHHLLPVPLGREAELLGCLVAQVLRTQSESDEVVRTVWEGLDELKASAADAAPRLGLTPGQIAAACGALVAGRRIVALCGDGRLAAGLHNLALLLEGADVRVCWTQAECNSLGAGLLEAAGHGQALTPERRDGVRGLYVVGANPAARWASARDHDMLAGLDVLVCQDLFFTETARMADVVLPAASFAEKTGTFTNQAGRVQPLQPALAPPGEARPDWEIVALLGLRFGWSIVYNGTEQIADEMAETIPGYAEAVATGRWAPRAPDAPGFVPLPPAPEFGGAEEFRLWIMPGPAHWRTGVLSRRSPALRALCEQAAARMNPADVETVGLKPGRRVEIANRAAAVRLPAQPDPDVPRGVVVVCPHFTETSPWPLAGRVDNREQTASIPVRVRAI